MLIFSIVTIFLIINYVLYVNYKINRFNENLVQEVNIFTTNQKDLSDKIDMLEEKLKKLKFFNDRIEVLESKVFNDIEVINEPKAIPNRKKKIN